MRREEQPVSGKEYVHHMKKTYGVCFGMLALGLAALGTPAGRAAGGSEANGAGGEAVASTTTSTTTTGSTTSPSPSSPEDLDRRIEALETELVSLRNEMAARKEAEASAAAAPVVTVAATPQETAPAKTTIASLLGPTSLSGFIDGYYLWNSDHPAGNAVGACAFDCRGQSISLNMIELILDKAPDATAGAAGRTGYHFSVGYGDTQTAIDNAEVAASGSGASSLGFDQYVKEAYFSYLAPIGKGLQIDVGKFVTPMGAEVIESKDNWNYSRGVLYTYAIPINHFGVRAKYTFNDKFNVTGFLVNGWNNVIDNNSGKTYGISAGLNPTKKNALTINYLAGPEEPTGYYGYTTPTDTTLVNVNNYWRQTWDVVYMYNLTSKLTFMANYDYAHGDRLIVGTSEYDDSGYGYSPYKLSKPVYWTGEAAYLKYAFDDKNYVAARYEYFYDRNGWYAGVDNPHSHIQEFTATYQRTLATHLLTRFEYRRDMAGQPIFELDNFSHGVKQQSTLTMGMIFLFDSRDAK